jgi:hypothetical protein
MLPRADIALTEQEESLVHFLAAIHNAHYGQKVDLIQYHAGRALDLSPAVSEAMQAYVDLQAYNVPNWMSSSYDELSRFPIVRRYLEVADPHTVDKFDDTQLVEVIQNELANRKIPLRNPIQSAAGTSQTDMQTADLLSPFHSAKTFRARMGYALGIRRNYFRATAQHSYFRLLRSSPSPLRIRITARRPKAGKDRNLTLVRVNDFVVAELDVVTSWRTLEFTVPEHATCAGTNVITIEWPVPEADYDSDLEEASGLLERGIMPDPLPVFGDVHTFVARPVHENHA